jgi:EmrB/QacA subfamily drug resistance transporter
MYYPSLPDERQGDFVTVTASTALPALGRRGWAALLVLCGALFLDGLDVSMVGMALPSIRDDLHLSTTSLQWVVSGYVLGYGGLLLLGGRAADLLGRRRVFVVAIAVFLVASLLGGLATDGTLLIATRFVKGVAAAFTAPAGLSIITTTFAEGPARNRALGVYTATGASGFSLGLVLGGLLTTAGWRWTFFLPVPVALAILLIAPRVIPADPAVEVGRRRYDLAGAATVTATMLLLVYTVTQAPQHGWTSARTLLLAAVTVLVATAFVVIEQRVAEPLVRLGILRSRRLVGANLSAMTIAGAYFSFQFVLTLYLQQHHGWSSLVTALAFLPAGALVAMMAPRIGPFATRVGVSRVLVAGMAMFVPGYALALRIGDHFSYASMLLPSILLLGLGFGLAFPTLNMEATSGVADHEQGLASALVNTSFQLGGAVVLAIVTAVVATRGAGDAASSISVYRPGLAVVAGAAAVGLAVALAAFGLGPRRAAGTAEELSPLEEAVEAEAA